MAAMRQRLLLVVGWVIVATVTSLVALGAVTVAGGRVNDRPLEPLSAAEVEALPVAVTVESANEPQASGGVDSVENTSEEAPDQTGQTREGDTTADGGGNSPDDRVGDIDQNRSTANFGDSVAEIAATQVAHLVGGSIGIRRLGGELFLEWVSPQPGFSTGLVLTQTDFVRVAFSSPTHRSLVLITLDISDIEVTITESST